MNNYTEWFKYLLCIKQLHNKYNLRQKYLRIFNDVLIQHMILHKIIHSMLEYD